MKKIYFLVGLSILSTSLAGCDGGDGSAIETQSEPPAHEHLWGTPTYAWSEDYLTCTAERVCLSDSTHKESETADSTYEIIVDAGCETNGTGRYAVSFQNRAFSMQTHDVAIASHDHDYQFDSFVWTDYSAQAKYVCTYDSSHVELFDATVVDETVENPTCDKAGKRVYTASYDVYTDTKTEILPKTDHNWGDTTYTWSDDYSTCTAERKCLTDNSHTESESVDATLETIPATFENETITSRRVAKFTNPSFEEQTIEETTPYYGTYPVFNADRTQVKYGLYPYHYVADANLVKQLNASATNVQGDWYFYEGAYYAKTRARPYQNRGWFDDYEEMVVGDDYWFQCDPIIWDVMAEDDAGVYLYSHILVDTLRYSSTTKDITVDGYTIHPSNYEHSDVREWLNKDFYRGAFSLDSSYIQDTTVEVSSVTLTDQVFMPSVDDYRNPEYGFMEGDGECEARTAEISEWTIARGAACFGYPGQRRTGHHWTITPSSSDGAYYINYNGEVYKGYTHSTAICVRPAITLKKA